METHVILLFHFFMFSAFKTNQDIPAYNTRNFCLPFLVSRGL